MVAHATHQPLPTLSPEDQSLLLRYFAGDLLSLTEGGGRGVVSSSPDARPTADLLSLYAFLSRPDIAAWVAFHRAEQHHAQKQLVIAQLTTVCKSSENLVEKRRAATTLLRALNSSATRPRPTTTAQPSPRPPVAAKPEPPRPSHPQTQLNSRAPGTPANHIPEPTFAPIGPVSHLLSLQGTVNPRPGSSPRTPHSAPLQPNSS